MKLCKVKKCYKKSDSLGYCTVHYGYFIRWGDPLKSKHKKRGLEPEGE